MNEQINKLITKQQNFKDAAGYMQGLQEDMAKRGDDLNDCINKLNAAVEAHNTCATEINAKAEELNGKIGDSDLKLKFHQGVDSKLVEDTKARMALFQEALKKKEQESKEA